jgi:hypothetical protein
MLSSALQRRWIQIAFSGVLLAFLVMICAAATVNAQSDDTITYNLLAPLPGGSNQVSGQSIFVDYAKQLFFFILTGAAVLAFMMIVMGGIEYMGGAGNPNTLKDARNRITNAILGLLLAVASYLILRTINQDLVSLKLDIPKVDGGAGNANNTNSGFNTGALIGAAPTDTSGIPGSSDFVGPIQPPPPPPFIPAGM